MSDETQQTVVEELQNLREVVDEAADFLLNFKYGVTSDNEVTYDWGKRNDILRKLRQCAQPADVKHFTQEAK